MLVKSDIYNCLGIEDQEEFKAKAILRNAARIESGEMPVHEILRQTGRTQSLVVDAITLLSVGAHVAIYAYSRHSGQQIRARIIATAEIVMTKTGHYIPVKNLVLTTPYSSAVDLRGRNIDASLYDEAIRDMKMRETGFYK